MQSPLCEFPRELKNTPIEPRRQNRSGYYENGQVWLHFQGGPHIRQVELAGELTGWSSKRLKLRRTSDHLFSLAVRLPLDGRLEYKFVVDGDWILDPWNPQQVVNGLGGMNSVLEMPGYQHDTHQLQIRDSAPRRLDSLLIHGQALPGARQIQIYSPANMDTTQRYPVLFFQDGTDYIERARLPQLLDHLIAHGEIPAVIAVCIQPLQRHTEYMLNPAYGQLLYHEILPLIKARYPISSRPQERILVGSSLGGLISSFVACQYRDGFGQVLGQSSSFQYAGEKLSAQLSRRRDLRFYLSAGRFEGLLQANRNLVSSLAQTGYDYKYREYNAGHNWTHWSNGLSEGLIYLLGKK